MMACLAVYMQQKPEQYGRSMEQSREPTHWMNTMFLGSMPSEGRWMWPPVGPEADIMRSYCRLVMTSGYAPPPYSLYTVQSTRS